MKARISNRLWSRICDRFSEEDKSRLRAAMVGEMLHPRGIIVDLEELDPDLRARVAEALQ